MPTTDRHLFNPRLDLVLERVVEVPRELVWRAWTFPEDLKHWFAPAPWTTVDCEIDLRPGGIFRVVMQSPEGKAYPNVGCYLDIVPNERLIWTDALLPGYRPSTDPFFTAILTLESHDRGTRIHGHSDASRRGDAKTARGDGLSEWLGQGARSAGRLRPHTVNRQSQRCGVSHSKNGAQRASSRSRYSLRNLAILGAITMRQYGCSPCRRK